MNNKGKVITMYTATAAVLSVKEGLPIHIGIGMGLVFSALVIGLGYLLQKAGLLHDL